MKTSEKSLGNILYSSIVDLLNKDLYLLKNDINERSISYRLGHYLQNTMFPAFHLEHQ